MRLSYSLLLSGFLIAFFSIMSLVITIPLKLSGDESVTPGLIWGLILSAIVGILIIIYGFKQNGKENRKTKEKRENE